MSDRIVLDDALEYFEMSMELWWRDSACFRTEVCSVRCQVGYPRAERCCSLEMSFPMSSLMMEAVTKNDQLKSGKPRFGVGLHRSRIRWSKSAPSFRVLQLLSSWYFAPQTFVFHVAMLGSLCIMSSSDGQLDGQTMFWHWWLFLVCQRKGRSKCKNTWNTVPRSINPPSCLGLPSST